MEPYNVDSKEERAADFLSGNVTRVHEDEYQIFVRPVARSRVLEALERHGRLAVSDAGVAVDDLSGRNVITCPKRGYLILRSR